MCPLRISPWLGTLCGATVQQGLGRGGLPHSQIKFLHYYPMNCTWPTVGCKKQGGECGSLQAKTKAKILVKVDMHSNCCKSLFFHMKPGGAYFLTVVRPVGGCWVVVAGRPI